MTTLTSPHDLLAAVPFLVGYRPENSLVVISLKAGSLGMAMRTDYPQDPEPEQLEAIANYLVREKADGALIVAYVPTEVVDSESLLEPLREIISLQGIPIRECLVIRNKNWRSSMCFDYECCPISGNEMPNLEASRIAAEQVADGKPLPFKDLEGMQESISPAGDAEDNALVELLKKIGEIDYQLDTYLVQQREGAIAVNDLIAIFAEAGICEDKKLIALVLARLQDLQVRDYAMGITNEENIQNLWSMWRWLLRIAPKGYIAPVASLFSAVTYEKGDGALAQRSLDRAFADDANYPLAKLLRRVYAAGWPPESFGIMRRDLHPKVCAALFGA